ncbi:hypothetical protein AB0D22_03920 [Kitasatospora sp. NPDC048538]|uniref:hypothetical protein n=1 Tax=Kitasatospora sp. NPDC048538 TaxID=3155633 RepID=UPI0033DDFDD3
MRRVETEPTAQVRQLGRQSLEVGDATVHFGAAPGECTAAAQAAFVFEDEDEVVHVTAGLDRCRLQGPCPTPVGRPRFVPGPAGRPPRPLRGVGQRCVREGPLAEGGPPDASEYRARGTERAGRSGEIGRPAPALLREAVPDEPQDGARDQAVPEEPDPVVRVAARLRARATLALAPAQADLYWWMDARELRRENLVPDFADAVGSNQELLRRALKTIDAALRDDTGRRDDGP